MNARPTDATYLLLIAWRVVTAFEDHDGLTDEDVAALRELVTEYASAGAR